MIPFNSITLSNCILDSRLFGKSVFRDRFDDKNKGVQNTLISQFLYNFLI